ncbi:uncharacterized protein SAPINGB_P005249 [Magnusiomyces paraingens]|uniref:DUF4110 domain-containing protein n=1 Tax=Magnusiomyces paraingens TaxID=2606893 RepID=A0A5E8BZ83_9ASCO|nr:uncharacterized protein SAPINGB_P005249 [Saprochaete ingens]VVT56754.1 unnamed protein product [Saprochaete ingens]
MAKKPTKVDKEAKKARMAEKNAKNAAKSDKKDKKLAKKNAGSDDEDDMDIDEILENYKKEQEAFQAVTITAVENGPSKRINATMVASPVQGKHELFLFGGETTETKQVRTGNRRFGTSSVMTETLAVFYNDLYHYSVDTDQWRLITSPNSPLPRSGHSMCAHPSGVILVFGGEFSSPKQTTFYHYGDTWVLDAEAKEWTKVEAKKGPSGRSGHRMTVWKNYILMHGGFRDLGTKSMYLNDLWAFDVTSYKWHQVEFPVTHLLPDARSGHSFLPHPEGAVVWGGYSKVKAPRNTQKGKVHTDTWLLKMKPDLVGVRWEKRKKAPYAPSQRVGCSMTHHRGRGILFGGVFDHEDDDDRLSSTFYNDLYAYQTEMNKWFTLKLRSPRKRAAQNQAQNRSGRRENRDTDLENTLSEILEGKLDLKDSDEEKPEAIKEEEEEVIIKKEYPVVNTLPHPRYNVTSAVVGDLLFLFGGGYEYKEKEYHLDSMYSIDLGKLDGCKVYWEDLTELENMEEEEEEEEDEDEDLEDDEGDDWEDDEDEIMNDGDDFEEEEDKEEEEEEEESEEIPDDRPWLPHPKPFESLRDFYARTSDELLKWAMSQDREARGKDLKRVAFELADDRWWERREVLRVQEDKMEELGGIGDVIEKDASKPKGRR